MIKVKIGDVFELKLENRNAYLQYAYRDRSNGHLIRVLNGFYDSRPENIKALTEGSEKFCVYFPLQVAVNHGTVEKIGNFSISKKFKIPEFMRSKHIIRGEFKGWHIVNTETKTRELVKVLSSIQEKLSPWGIWNDTLLKERLSEGWSPEVEAKNHKVQNGV